MATRRTTFDKLQRERARRAKAAAKRERRQERSSGDDAEAVADAPSFEESSADLLQQIETLHKRFEDGEIGYDDFEEQKADLFNRLAALPMD